MKVAVLQSNYIPWKGYFDIIHDVDAFVFYDDVQYTKNDWRNRNRVKTAGGPCWLTIPVGSSLDRRVCDVRIQDHAWQRKHLATLRQAYARSEHFASHADLLGRIYEDRAWASLSEFNHFTVKAIAGALGIGTRFLDSREYEATGTKQDRLVSLLQAVGATHYLSGPAARAYIHQEAFDDAGIMLEYKDYSGYPDYPQPHPPFEHAVSVLDLLFNTGPRAGWHIWGWRDAGSRPDDGAIRR